MQHSPDLTTDDSIAPQSPSGMVKLFIFCFVGFLAAEGLGFLAYSLIPHGLPSDINAILENPMALQVSALLSQMARLFFVFVLLLHAEFRAVLLQYFRPVKSIGILLRWAFGGWFFAFAVTLATNFIAVTIFGMEPIEDENPIRNISGAENAAVLIPLFILNVVILAPIIEETVFRGYLLGLAERFAGQGIAIALTAFLFAVVHFQLQVGLTLFAIGAITALATLRTGSIYPAIGIHIINNGFVAVITIFQ